MARERIKSLFGFPHIAIDAEPYGVVAGKQHPKLLKFDVIFNTRCHGTFIHNLASGEVELPVMLRNMLVEKYHKIIGLDRVAFLKALEHTQVKNLPEEVVRAMAMRPPLYSDYVIVEIHEHAIEESRKMPLHEIARLELLRRGVYFDNAAYRRETLGEYVITPAAIDYVSLHFAIDLFRDTDGKPCGLHTWLMSITKQTVDIRLNWPTAYKKHHGEGGTHIQKLFSFSEIEDLYVLFVKLHDDGLAELISIRKATLRERDENGEEIVDT